MEIEVTNTSLRFGEKCGDDICGVEITLNISGEFNVDVDDGTPLVGVHNVGVANVDQIRELASALNRKADHVDPHSENDE